MLVGLTDNVPLAAAPVPESEIGNDGFEALDVTVMVPPKFPAEVGVKFALKETAWLGPMVKGEEMPLMLKPAPLLEIAETVTSDAPVLPRVIGMVLVVFTLTLPKAALVGLEARVPGPTPVPPSGIVSVGLEAFEVMVSVPIAVPTVVGAKVTVKFVLLEALIVNGVVSPLN